MSQAKKTLALLGALALLAGGLSLYAYFGVLEADRAEADRKQLTDRLFPLVDPGQTSPDGGALQPSFTSVTVQLGDETTVIERSDGGTWRLIAPVQAPADKLAVDSLVSQLQTAQVKEKVEDTPDDKALEQYGLKSPKFTVTAHGHAGDASRSKELTVFGGIENPFDGSVYVQRKGEKAVYLAGGGVRWALAKSTFELREKQVLSLDDAKVKAIDVRAPHHAFALERSDARSWRLVRPLQADADASSITTLLGTLRSERALSFPPDSPDARRSFGLESPWAEATFTLEGGETVRLRFGRPGADAGTQTYVLREDQDGAVLAEVNASVAEQLDRNPAELKDRTVLPFKKEEVTKATFRLADGSELSVERVLGADGGTSEDWNVLLPQKAPAKKFKLSSILWAVGALKATRVVEAQPKDWAKYGISERSRSVTLFGRDGQELGRLVLGKELPEKAGAFFARSARGELVELDGERLSELPASAADLIDVPSGDAGAALAGP